MKVMAQMGMVMNLDKCIGCHTCSVTCKQAWTNRAGVEYVVQQRGDAARTGVIRVPTRTRTSGRAAGSAPNGQAEAAFGQPVAPVDDHLHQPGTA